MCVGYSQDPNKFTGVNKFTCRKKANCTNKLTGPNKFTGQKTLSCCSCYFYTKDINKRECLGVKQPNLLFNTSLDK